MGLGSRLQLSKWLCKFCTEARKQSGKPYPPKTIQHYLLGLQRHIRSQKGSAINFIEDIEFLSLRKLLDALYRKLHAQGIGCSVKKTFSTCSLPCSVTCVASACSLPVL